MELKRAKEESLRGTSFGAKALVVLVSKIKEFLLVAISLGW